MMQNPILSRCKWAFVVFLSAFTLFPPVTLAGGDPGLESVSNTELIALVQQLSSRFFEGKVAVTSLETELSAKAELAENKESWQIKSDKYNVRVIAKAKAKSAEISELLFYPVNIRQLALKDLTKIFGDSRVFIRSKTTWVEFDSPKTQNNRHYTIVAQLYAPPESEVSPVIALKLGLE